MYLWFMVYSMYGQLFYQFCITISDLIAVFKADALTKSSATNSDSSNPTNDMAVDMTSNQNLFKKYSQLTVKGSYMQYLRINAYVCMRA